MKEENDDIRRNLTNPEQTLTEEEPTKEHNPEPKEDGTGRERDACKHSAITTFMLFNPCIGVEGFKPR